MSWRNDAREFGLHIKQGGWRLGLLVARSVVMGPAGADTRADGKTGAQGFCEVAGLSAKTILLYLAGWERAADAGIVPHARDLHPESEPDLHIALMPEWRQFYRSERELAGRASSVEIHPDPKVMQRRLEKDPARAERIMGAVERGLPPEPAAELAQRLAQRVEHEHIPPPQPDPAQPRPTFIVVESVQRVLDALELVRAEVNRLPPVMTTNSKKLLARQARETLPVIQDLIDLAADIHVGAGA